MISPFYTPLDIEIKRIENILDAHSIADCDNWNCTCTHNGKTMTEIRTEYGHLLAKKMVYEL